MLQNIISNKNKKIKYYKKKKKRKISFKSYIKTLYRDVNEVMHKKRKKVSQDDFQILQFSQYNNITQKKYHS